jgi:hypothetical protein
MSDALEIPGFLDRRAARPLVYTYTILNTYASICPEQMQRRYVARDIKYVETPAMARGNAVHAAMEQRVGRGAALPDEMARWEPLAAPFARRLAYPERKLGITSAGAQTGYWDADCWFRGKIDVSIVQGETGFINDWKSGSSRYEDPFELETNAVLLRGAHPGLRKVLGTYTWLAENRVSRAYDLSGFDATLARMHRIAAAIERDRQAGEWEKRRSGLCGRCDVLDCEHNTKR